jgi:hypothetical protein
MDVVLGVTEEHGSISSKFAIVSVHDRRKRAKFTVD